MTSIGVTLPLVAIAAETGFTVARLRGFVTSALSDADLQLLLNAAIADVARALGPLAVRERLGARGDMLLLSRPAASVTSIVEDDRSAALTLATDDYELSDTGQVLYRLRNGTHPAQWWRGRVDVRYVRVDDTAARIRAYVALVELDLNHKPGLAAQAIGTWSEQYTSNSAFNYELERASILASLDEPGGIR